MMPNRWIFFWYAVLTILLPGVCGAGSQVKPPVCIGPDADFGHATSTSVEAIGHGIFVTMEEIKNLGGVLNARSLVLEVRDNRFVPARNIDSLKELNVVTDLVAASRAYMPTMSKPCVRDLRRWWINF